MEHLLETLARLPPAALYLAVALGAAVENVAPVVPSDTFVLFGAFLAATGRAEPWAVLLATWAANVAGALAVYRLAHVYGRAFFNTWTGHRLLHPHQIRKLSHFYSRYGVLAIFLSRFLPGFRVMVPVFAGALHMPLRAIAPPIALASLVWYSALVVLGAFTGRNWQAVVAIFARFSHVLLAIGVLVAIAGIMWWLRSRVMKP